MVADLTANRAGVYYEVGFAAGQGMPVIHIVKCFHYVRTRELVMVLNAAETVRRASTNKKDLLFFHGMRKCNKEFIKTFCRGCPNETLCGR